MPRIDASLKTLIAQMYGMSLAYDEGIVAGDPVLYAALWRYVCAGRGAREHTALTAAICRDG